MRNYTVRYTTADGKTAAIVISAENEQQAKHEAEKVLPEDVTIIELKAA